MLDLKNKLVIQDLISELEQNKIKYGMTMNKWTRNSEITYIEIRIEGKEK